MAKEAERKAKLAKKTGPQKVATIDLSEKWINWLLVALLAFQVFLNIAAYNASLSGMNNLSLFFVGLILIVFAGFFHLYRYAMNKSKEAPPSPPVQLVEEKPRVIAQTEMPPELPDVTSGEVTKEIHDVSKINADIDTNSETKIGSSDLSKP